MREIALIGFVQTLFFSLLILTKKKKEIKDYLLVVFLLFVGAELIYRFLILTTPESQIKWITLFDTVYWALFGPITLLYILFTIDKTKKFYFIHVLHLIPLCISLYAVKNYFLGSIEYNTFIEYFNESTGIIKTSLYIWEFSSPIYLFYSLYILFIHKKAVKNYFSETSGKDIQWLSILISVFILHSIISYVIWFAEDIFHIEIKFKMFEILPATLTAYVFFIGFYGYKQAGIFFNLPNEKNELINKNKKVYQAKYSKSGLTEIERSELISNLKEVMEIDKSYLNPDINVLNLAERLNTSFYKISQVINESFQQNFYDYINKYRIEESKSLLNKQEEVEKYTILSIAFESGFSSKSSFYNAFKKNTGITPGDYVKKINKQRFKVMAN